MCTAVKLAVMLLTFVSVFAIKNSDGTNELKSMNIEDNGRIEEVDVLADVQAVAENTHAGQDGKVNDGKIKVILTIVTGPASDKSNSDENYDFDNQVSWAKTLAATNAVTMGLGRVVIERHKVVVSTPDQVEKKWEKGPKELGEHKCAACIDCVTNSGKFINFMYGVNNKKKKWCSTDVDKGTDHCTLECSAFTLQWPSVTYDTHAAKGSELTLVNEAARGQDTTFSMVVSSDTYSTSALESDIFKKETRLYIPVDDKGSYHDINTQAPHALYFRVQNVSP